jgi:hypothetical protein
MISCYDEIFLSINLGVKICKSIREQGLAVEMKNLRTGPSSFSGTLRRARICSINTSTMNAVNNADGEVLESYRNYLHQSDASALEKVRAKLESDERDKPPEQHAQEVYALCNSLAQSKRSRNGRALERAIHKQLVQRGIPFLEQCSVHQGHVSKARRGGVHTYDFVIGAQEGDPIRDAIVLSCKASVRERYLQDKQVPCKALYMITLDAVRDTSKYEQQNIHLVTVDATTGALHTMLETILATTAP